MMRRQAVQWRGVLAFGFIVLLQGLLGAASASPELEPWHLREYVPGFGTEFQGALYHFAGFPSERSEPFAVLRTESGAVRALPIRLFADPDRAWLEALRQRMADMATRPVEDAVYLPAPDMYTGHPVNEALTPHFRVVWGNDSNGSGWRFFDPAFREMNLQYLEAIWDYFAYYVGAPMPYADEEVKYKINVYITGTGLPYHQEGWAFGAQDIVIHPDAMLEGSSVIPHEFGHVLQFYSGGYRDNPYVGWFWESHANWIQFQYIPSYPAVLAHYADRAHFNLPSISLRGGADEGARRGLADQPFRLWRRPGPLRARVTFGSHLRLTYARAGIRKGDCPYRACKERVYVMVRRAMQTLIGLVVMFCVLMPGMAAEIPHGGAAEDGAETSVKDAVEAQVRFGLALYRGLAAASEDESVFISPTSVYTALGMAFNGAQGATKEAMERVLGMEGVNRDSLNEALQALLDALEAEGEGGVRLNIANGLWYREGIPFHPGFLGRIEGYYRAGMAPLDFRAPESPAVVNEWVSEKTNGLIRHLIDQFDPDTILLLVNTVYFKGAWTHPFTAAATRDLPFHLPSGQTKEVPMMYRDGRIQHLEGDGFQAIRLPYGEEEAMAMYVFLPNADSDLAAFHQALTYENWERWMTGFQAKQGQVYLPRIDIEYKETLNDVLQQLGMGIAFMPRQADFGLMLQEGAGIDVSITEVIHQTVLKVDEEGTEAAAATSIGFRATSLPVYQFTFRADRPFFLAIRDEVSGALLFAGAILDPGTS